ncbi:MAG TPA: M14 family zinc carboxypeptidase, partial [Verrucomicrobiae bacterium]
LEDLVRKGYDVDLVKTNLAVVFADPEELNNLRGAGWEIRVLPAPSTPSVKALGAYNGYTNLTAMLNSYATNYPALCRKFSLGKSVQGRELWALKITTNPDTPQDKPKFRYMSTIHGNEPVGTEMCLYLIDLLLKGYGSNDTRIVNLVSNVEIWIVPLLNPDGRESNPPQRYNASGYDLNRSFPEGSATNLGNMLYGPVMITNTLQPEVRAVMNWTTNHDFSLGANFHTGSVVVNYPYDNDNQGSVFSPSPDQALFVAMSTSYASNNAPMWANNSAPFVNGIVNGADWYAISGGLQDWSYRYDGSLEVTIELSDYQWPDPAASELPTYWSQNRESMLSYMEWVLRGVRGVLRDAQTGQPIRGVVRVEGFHHLVFSDGSVGDYHRLLLPGTYSLWFSAPGYITRQVTNVVVGAGAATRLDVALQPVSSRFAASIHFQPAIATVPAGCAIDTGSAFGTRGNGYTYGWETTLAGSNLIARDAGSSQDPRYDALCQMQGGGNHLWEIAVPNGPYSVHVTVGDPNYASGTYRILAENQLLLSGTPSAQDRWVEGQGIVTVTDGRLTLSNGSGAVSNRLALVEISAVEPATVDQWRARWFGTVTNTGTAADAADPDRDGLPNFLEYAFGFNPTNAETGWHVSAATIHTNNANWLAYSFFRNINATDVTFSLQAASTITATLWTNVVTWTNVAGWSNPALVTETNAGSGRTWTTVKDPLPIGSASSRFLRLQVSKP